MSVDASIERVRQLVGTQQPLDPSCCVASRRTETLNAPSTGQATGPSFADVLAGAQAAPATLPTPVTSPGGGVFLPHGGEYGFFPAAGTNYTYGKEPEIAARLDALGKALHLHLVGISGYRTPAHSVAVGGFADDRHTRGEAMDTPGVEGVPEATLRQYGLTRPFPGAREADHIQLA